MPSSLVSNSYGHRGVGIYRGGLLGETRIANSERYGGCRRQYSATLGNSDRVCLRGNRRLYLVADHPDSYLTPSDLIEHCKRLAFASETRRIHLNVQISWRCETWTASSRT